MRTEESRSGEDRQDLGTGGVGHGGDPRMDGVGRERPCVGKMGDKGPLKILIELIGCCRINGIR